MKVIIRLLPLTYFPVPAACMPFMQKTTLYCVCGNNVKPGNNYVSVLPDK